jgi:RNA polymerase sigma-70 factor, ECF subfamily
MSQFGLLVAAEIPSLRRYARSLTHDPTSAEDLTQSCVLRALAKQHLWQPGTSLRCWLFTMLHNLRVSQVRRSVREHRGQDTISAFAPRLREPQSVTEIVDLERAIAKLPEWQRQVLQMIGIEEKSYAQAAAALGLREGTVRSRLGRARASLRQLTGREAANSGADANSHSVSALVAHAATGNRAARLHVRHAA